MSGQSTTEIGPSRWKWLGLFAQGHCKKARTRKGIERGTQPMHTDMINHFAVVNVALERLTTARDRHSEARV